MAARRDDQDLPRVDTIDGERNGAEIGRIAQDREGAAEQAMLLAGRTERPDGRINLAACSVEIDRDGHRNGTPAINLRGGQVIGIDHMGYDGHGWVPSGWAG